MTEGLTRINIESTAGLDPITIFLEDFEPGRGQITILCYGMAWTAYFGRMGDATIRAFAARSDTGYLVDKLGYKGGLLQRKRDLDYLSRIVNSVRAELARTAPQAPTKHNPPQGFVLDAPIFGEARTAPQEGAEVDWSDDESVVRAAVPSLWYNAAGQVGRGTYVWDSWRSARRNDPVVIAFESVNNPARKEQR